MARRSGRDDEIGGRQRFVDQPGQWKNITPASIRRRQAKAWKALEDSLTPAQRKAIGLKPKAKKKKK